MTAPLLEGSQNRPEVWFDPDTHEYRIGGEVVPSVTQVLAAFGMSTDYAGVPSAVLANAARRGRRLHRALHLLLEDDLEWSSIHPMYRPVLEHAQRTLADAGIDPEHAVLERPMASVQWRFGTTPDIFTPTLYGAPAIIETKSVAKAEAGPLRLQVAGQRIALAELFPAATDAAAFCLRLDWRQGTSRLVELETSAVDVADFQALVRLWWRRRDPAHTKGV